ncbi:hypothetical protein KAR91_06035, partial [Candidatus Pacearchaeota archaeon]|nr:hypothetical protein [Candidatus Pacearchaeota archaeon]
MPDELIFSFDASMTAIKPPYQDSVFVNGQFIGELDMGVNQCGVYDSLFYANILTQAALGENTIEIRSDLEGDNYDDVWIRNLKVFSRYIHTGVGGKEDQIVIESYYLRASPNPFNPTTSIQFDIPAAGQGSIKIYGIRGELVTTLHHGRIPAGPGTVVWSG